MKNKSNGGGEVTHHHHYKLFSKLGRDINEILTLFKEKGVKNNDGWVSNTYPLEWGSNTYPLLNNIARLIDALSDKNKQIIIFFLLKNGFGWRKLFLNDFGINSAKFLLSELENLNIVKRCRNKNKEMIKFFQSKHHFDKAILYELTNWVIAFVKEFNNWNLNRSTIEKIENWKPQQIFKKEEIKERRIKKKYGDKIKEYGIEDIDEIDKLERILPDTKAKEVYLEIKKDRIRKGKKVTSSAQIHFILQRSGIIKTKSSIKNYIRIIERSGLIEKISKPDEIGRFIVKSPDEIFESENESN